MVNHYYGLRTPVKRARNSKKIGVKTANTVITVPLDGVSSLGWFRLDGLVAIILSFVHRKVSLFILIETFLILILH